MNIETFLDGLIRDREGGFDDDVDDRGGATKFGITANELGRWRQLGHQATAADVAALEEPEARAIYRAWYLAPYAWVTNDALCAQLADFAVTSGHLAAVMALQRVLHVDVDGRAGPQTRAALASSADARLVNDALVAERCALCVAIVKVRPSQLKWFHGWCARAVGFLQSEVPQ